MSGATVQKYAKYSAALDAIAQNAPELVPHILSGAYKISFENIVALSEMGPEELKTLSRKIGKNPYEVFMANVEAGNQEQLMIKDLVESYSLSIGQVRNYGVVCAVSTLENIYERFGYHVLDRTLRLCVGTWEGDMNSLSANMLNGIARLVYTFGDALKDETFKEKVGEMSVKLLSRTAKERRPGSMGYAEAMLLAYNRKCKYPLKWTKLYEKNVGNNEGLDIDTDMDEDEGGDSFEGAAKE